MRFKIFLCTLFLFPLYTLAKSGTIEDTAFLTPQFGLHIFDDDRNISGRKKFTYGLSIDRVFTNWGIGGYFGLVEGNDYKDLALYISRYFNIKNKVFPFVAAGAGINTYNDDKRSLIGPYVSIGFHYIIKNNIAFYFSIKDFYLWKGRNDIVPTIGISYVFGDRDKDKDGVPNNKDQCPGTPYGVKVDNKGCPLDSDGDGIPDYKDKCPATSPGIKVDNTGCSLDSDGDGIPDSIDRCPDTPKNVETDRYGCPKDSDLDGVPDYLDKCSHTLIGQKVDKEGCPVELDSDNDGVLDKYDRCPDTPKGVKVDKNGCPVDSDKDRVPDYKDKCPDTPEGVIVNIDGCPIDSDNDGVPDYKDKCPNTSEGLEVDEEGCPLDSDLDGIPDYKDRCPDTPEGVKVDKNGCPVDSDKDGVPDYLDECPNTPKGVKVDEKGCFKEVKLEIYFDVDSAVIKPKYYPEIEKLAKILKENPDLKVEIQGHTDNTGSKKYNLILSQKRAEAVRKILIEKFGIDPERVIAKGYGESKPIASNDTEEGKKLNRRVIAVPIK